MTKAISPDAEAFVAKWHNSKREREREERERERERERENKERETHCSVGSYR